MNCWCSGQTDRQAGAWSRNRPTRAAASWPVWTSRWSTWRILPERWTWRRRRILLETLLTDFLFPRLITLFVITDNVQQRSLTHDVSLHPPTYCMIYLILGLIIARIIWGRRERTLADPILYLKCGQFAHTLGPQPTYFS